MVRGRAFNDGDTVSAAPVVILSEMTARQMFGSVDVIGQSIAITRRRATVAGRDRRRRARHRRAVHPRRPAAVDLRAIRAAACHRRHDCRAIERRRRARRAGVARGDSQGRSRSRRSTQSAPGVPSSPVRSSCVRSAGMGTLYLGAFTLLLSMVGLFGVQSHVVSYRTREIGVRMSVGASARQIKLMVIKDGYRPVIEGLDSRPVGRPRRPRDRARLPGRRRQRRRSVDAADHAGAVDPRRVPGLLPAGIARRERGPDRGAAM